MMELINNKVPAASLPAEKRQIQIHNLPEELLDVILQYVKTSASTGQFWDCFRTCRQWHRIGLGVHGNLELSMLAILESGTRRHKMMQEDPEMNIKIVTNFAIHLPSRLCLSVLRALTVYVMNARIASPFNPNKKDFFGSLADTFKTTKKLSSFSLKFADDGWDFPFTDVPAISETQLARLVSALPSTVINLEIDTAGADLPRSEEMLKVNPDNYLCYLIGKIFPRLQHVRLRAAHVCQALLESGLNFDPSCCTKAYCGVRRHIQSCQITFSWALRTLSVWMPIKEDERSSSFIQAAKVLTEHCACHSPIIRLVYQEHILRSTRSSHDSMIVPCTKFTLTMKSNFGTEEQIIGISSHSHRPRSVFEWQALPYREHGAILRSPRRHFQFGERNPYPYIAQWSLEHQHRWVQDGPLSCRYPAYEALGKKQPLWKSSYWTGGEFACLFPKCQTRCPTLVALRGHQMYAHPGEPHDRTYHGPHLCPTVGCPRVALRGFSRKEEMEEHLLSHHMEPYTMG